MPKVVELLVGSPKGAFIFRSADDRRTWTAENRCLTDAEVNHIIRDPRDGTLYAAANSVFYGPSVRRSRDGGRTWDSGGEGLAYAADDPEQVKKVWHILPGPASQPGRLFAGVEASGLFVTDDHGDHWREVASLRRHPTHEHWHPGAGGKCLHTILQDPRDPDRIYIACSTGGAYRTDDGGESWRPVNAGLKAEFFPEGQQFPEAGQCVHKMSLCEARPDRIYLQNHGGVYRSDDGAATWVNVGAGLSSDFGFPIVAHPRNPDTAYVVPIASGLNHVFPDAKPRVWRTDDAGQSWRPLGTGFPEPAFVNVLRDAFVSDGLEPLGLYVGTTSGSIFASRDGGETWTEIVRHLPRIMSVEAQLVDA